MGPNLGHVAVGNPSYRMPNWQSGHQLLMAMDMRSVKSVRRLSADERAARLRDTARLVERLGKDRRAARTAPRPGSRR